VDRPGKKLKQERLAKEKLLIQEISLRYKEKLRKEQALASVKD
jgi:hypothetical protein